MSETMIKCRCCGGEVYLAEEEASKRCIYCKTLNERPKAKGETLNLLNLATEQRQFLDFDHAEESYRRVLELQKDEHEARWGLVLCKYGVEYVEDGGAGRRLPVCHKVCAKPMVEDQDFLAACELAPESVRNDYERDAEYITRAQQRIHELLRNEPDYEIFLCYKATKLSSSDVTEDSWLAQDMYNRLTKQGYRVFFAPVSLADKAGANYEACIYHAIETAKVMLVIGLNPAHFDATWVRSEWSRFLERIDNGESKVLLPIFGKMSADELPLAFRNRNIHGLDMDSSTWQISLDTILLECLKHEPPKPEPPRPELTKPEPIPGGQTVRQGASGWKSMFMDAVNNFVPKGEELIGKLRDNLPEMPAKMWPNSSRGNQTSKTAQRSPLDSISLEPAYVEAGDVSIGNDGHGGVTIVSYNARNKANVIVPEQIGGKFVTVIGGGQLMRLRGGYAGGFAEHLELRSVELPKLLMSIDHHAFYKCRNLKSVLLPSGLRSIGGYAFQDCDSLESVSLPRNMTSLETFAFEGCSALAEVTLPDGLKIIESYVFRGCSHLTAVTVPSGVVSIGMHAFDGCTMLSKAVLPVGLTRIEDGAFSHCQSLKTITIPDSVKKIGNGAFDGNIMIRCGRRSYAEKWAKKNNISFQNE